MIQLEKVSKTFNVKDNQVKAVKNVDLAIEKQDIFGIIGQSGAGKSTLIRCLNLLERPDEGHVVIDGVDLMELNEKELRVQRRKIGMIFQHFNLLKARSVYQNIYFALEKSSLSKQQKDEKIMSLLNLVGLMDKKDSYPAQLSGGQKQRVAIARSLANDPEVLLCDEATSALDPQTTKSILSLLKEVNERLGITIVLITHEMAVVKEICHHVAIMQDGNIIESGSTIDLFAHPKEDLTKQFVDATSSTHKIYELIENGHPITKTVENEKMYLLTYIGDTTAQHMISDICKSYDAQMNIIFGNIEVIQQTAIGKLVVVIKACGSQHQEIINYIQGNHVEVEVLK